MPFDSPAYVLLFLPAMAAVFLLLQRGERLRMPAIVWLILGSLFFYAWGSPRALLLLLASTLFNYACGLQLQRRPSRWLLALGITLNVLLLGIFKYSRFFLDTLNQLAGTGIPLPSLLLPLGISFFTFRNIAYLVDTYRGKAGRSGFLKFCLFSTFFPQLLAGPIVRHADVVPQLRREGKHSFPWEDLAVGCTIIIIGLFKKVLLADSISAYATPVFAAADAGIAPPFLEAWGAALAYAFQLYFDFSAYTDIAIGSARLFGIVLPPNFDAPYRSRSIGEFWRRWHITLSNFLRDYVYISLGGSRKGEVRTCLNLFLTMFIGGIWHGAGWTFVLWGAMHGLMLAGHRLWTRMAKHPRLALPAALIGGVSMPLTFLAVLLSWVLFRAETVAGALLLFQSMAGLTAAASPVIPPAAWRRGVQLLFGLAGIVWFAPTIQEFLSAHRPVLGFTVPAHPSPLPLRWKPRAFHALAMTLLAVTAVSVLFLAQDHVFLYFKF